MMATKTKTKKKYCFVDEQNNNGGDFIAGLKVNFIVDFENETNVFNL